MVFLKLLFSSYPVKFHCFNPTPVLTSFFPRRTVIYRRPSQIRRWFRVFYRNNLSLVFLRKVRVPYSIAPDRKPLRLTVYDIDRRINCCIVHTIMWRFAYLLYKTIKITWRPGNGKILKKIGICEFLYEDENTYVIINPYAKLYVEVFNVQFVCDIVMYIKP